MINIPPGWTNLAKSLGDIKNSVADKFASKGIGAASPKIVEPKGNQAVIKIPQSKEKKPSLPRPKMPRTPENMKVFMKQGAKHGIKLGVFLLLFFIVGALIIPFIYDTPILPAHLVTKAVSGFFSFIVNFETWISTFDPISTWNSFLEKQVDIAQGGYYEGKVDQQKVGALNIPLGIEFKEFKPQKSYFVKGEDDVVLWGRVRARLLDMDEGEERTPVHIETYCSIPFSKEERIFNDNTEGNLDKEIVDYGDEYFECTFNKDNIEEKGGFMVESHLKFNFETMAYLRTYFMDESRIKLYRMQDKDPLYEYGVVDAHPIAVYTSGPVKLTIGTNEEFPLKVPEEGKESTIFGLIIENRHKSEGFISRINELYIEIPDGLELDRNSCDFDFGEPEVREDRGSHVMYKRYKILTKEGKLTSSKLEQIDEYIKINCKMFVEDRDKILGNSAFSVQYLRADVKYDYILSKKTPIYIKDKDELRDYGRDDTI